LIISLFWHGEKNKLPLKRKKLFGIQGLLDLFFFQNNKMTKLFLIAQNPKLFVWVFFSFHYVFFLSHGINDLVT
jgi:hypothetical protein